uniref:T-cell surface glycoprotein CD3 delta chain n=1 Tax=Catagonus wagneri TaxID=51154 RepID=A0A8C3WAF0_9CETA
MEHSRFLSGLLLAALLSQVSPNEVKLVETEDKVFVSCNTSITRIEGTEGTLLSDDKILDLGKRILDPRGMYKCYVSNEQDSDSKTFLQVYYRTADTQDLLRNDQLYQPLRDRNDGQYSRLGENWARNK